MTIPVPVNNPERPGYNFKHWSLTEGGPAFEFDTVIDKDTLLYAVWEGKPVDYTVVYWLEKPNIPGDPGDVADNYVYYADAKGQATAGSVLDFETDPALRASLQNITVPVTRGSGGGATQHNLKIADFAFSPEVEVLGNGNTVVNVYYKRIAFTYEFKLNTGESGGEWYNLTHKKTTQCMEFNGLTYRADGPKYTFTAKYEQDIENLWPSSANAKFWEEEIVCERDWPWQDWGE